MPTTAQILANRNNSQKSTGPRTAEGKAAVSKNAVKHGLFAAEAVVTGENPAEYEAYHDQFLAELAPVGMVESMLAERFVSLSWRLRRAERMQNQSIDDMIDHKVTNKSARRHRECYYLNQGIRPGDPRFDLDHLPLGRIATSDWSDRRVLDRMMMYERRIENSLHKTMRELERRQLIRQFQEERAEICEPSPPLRDEAATRPAGKNGDLKKQTQNRPLAGNPKHETRNPKRVEKVDLKKQTQFTPGQNGAMSLMKGDYNNNPVCGIEENKPNSNPNKANQSQLHESVLAKVAGKRKKSLAAAKSLAG